MNADDVKITLGNTRKAEKKALLRRYAIGAVVACAVHFGLLAGQGKKPAVHLVGDEEGGSDAIELSVDFTPDRDETLTGASSASSAVAQTQAAQPELLTKEMFLDQFTQPFQLDRPAVATADFASLVREQIGAAVQAGLKGAGNAGVGAGAGRSGQGYKVGKGKPVYAPAPPYPQAARDQGREGVVEVTVLVNYHGRAKRAEISHSSGHDDLDEAARTTVLSRWKFPAHEDEIQIVRIFFSLTDRLVTERQQNTFATAR